eukprot:112747-Pelagomonas_calceolata.AAC.1
MERADMGIRASEQHMFSILYVIRITDITDRRSTIGIHNRMGMKFASKFIGALVVKSQLFKL